MIKANEAFTKTQEGNEKLLKEKLEGISELIRVSADQGLYELNLKLDDSSVTDRLAQELLKSGFRTKTHSNKFFIFISWDTDKKDDELVIPGEYLKTSAPASNKPQVIEKKDTPGMFIPGVSTEVLPVITVPDEYANDGPPPDPALDMLK